METMNKFLELQKLLGGVSEQYRSQFNTFIHDLLRSCHKKCLYNTQAEGYEALCLLTDVIHNMTMDLTKKSEEKERNLADVKEEPIGGKPTFRVLEKGKLTYHIPVNSHDNTLTLVIEGKEVTISEMCAIDLVHYLQKALVHLA